MLYQGKARVCEIDRLLVGHQGHCLRGKDENGVAARSSLLAVFHATITSS